MIFAKKLIPALDYDIIQQIKNKKMFLNLRDVFFSLCNSPPPLFSTLSYDILFLFLGGGGLDSYGSYITVPLTAVFIVVSRYVDSLIALISYLGKNKNKL